MLLHRFDFILLASAEFLRGKLRSYTQAYSDKDMSVTAYLRDMSMPEMKDIYNSGTLRLRYLVEGRSVV